MKKHSGMRPHDVAVLLKIVAKGNAPWLMKDIASEMGISASEVSESLHRSAYAGLIAGNKKQIMKIALLEFLQYGLRYVYPQQPGALLRGVPTAWSAPPLAEHIASSEVVVWPYAKGTVRGQALEPLYQGAVQASLHDSNFYQLMALADALRIGKAREKTMALNELKKRLA